MFRQQGIVFAVSAVAMLTTSDAWGQKPVTVLHTFMGGPHDGGFSLSGLATINPGPLVLSGNSLFGITAVGGAANSGTVFEIGTDGSDFGLLHSFGFGSSPDGAIPNSLLLAGSTLYGTTEAGITADPALTIGTLFGINTDGTGYKAVHAFTFNGDDGFFPTGVLVHSGSTLFGIIARSGAKIFHGDTDGSNFGATSSLTDVPSAIALSGLALYAIAGNTFFRVNTDGSSYQTLATIPQSTSGPLIIWGSTIYGINYDVTFPLTQDPSSPNYLYSSYSSSLFKINTDGSGYHILKTMTGTGPDDPQGLSPALTFSGSTLYASVPDDLQGKGLLYKINVDGSDYQTLSALPYGSGSLMVDGPMLYGIVGHIAEPGTAQGEVFSLAIPEPSCAMLLTVEAALLITRRRSRRT